LKVIVGLGNPGPEYAGNRHNMGFAVIDALADKFRADVTARAHKALVGRARLAGVEALLVKPHTYMNLSGNAVAPILSEMKAGPDDLIVVHDDIDLPLGSIRIRKSGGAGGQNGVASIMGSLGTDRFIRVKLGVGRPPSGVDPADHVLSCFTADELLVAREVAARAVEAIMAVLKEGPDRAMNRFNKNPEKQEEASD
jgi:PTH1 family peptidyl-tRNA hydrolase